MVVDHCVLTPMWSSSKKIITTCIARDFQVLTTLFPRSEKDNGEGEHDHEPVAYTDEQLSGIVDAVMKNMDRNNDGVVDWPEYVLSSSRR